MSSKKPTASVRDFYTMPLFALFVLVVGFYVLNYVLLGLANERPAHFSGGYDLTFIGTTAYIVASHVIAFSVVPLLALRKSITKESRVLYITFGLMTIVMLLTARLFSIGFARLDCGSQCVDPVIPLVLDFHVLLYTALALGIAFTLLLRAFNKKLRQSQF